MLDTLCSIRPTLKRVIREVNLRYAQALAGGWRCVACGAAARMRLSSPEESPAFLQRFALHVACSTCHFVHWVWAGGTIGLTNAATQETVRRFLREHPRWVMEPDTLVEHQGVEAIRSRLSDVASSARLTLFVARHDLRLLGSFHD
jgi:hypothetical protein